MKSNFLLAKSSKILVKSHFLLAKSRWNPTFCWLNPAKSQRWLRWSLGVLTFELNAGHTPWDDEGLAALFGTGCSFLGIYIIPDYFYHESLPPAISWDISNIFQLIVVFGFMISHLIMVVISMVSYLNCTPLAHGCRKLLAIRRSQAVFWYSPTAPWWSWPCRWGSMVWHHGDSPLHFCDSSHAHWPRR